MLHNVCAVEWKIEICCHGCYVAMETSQMSYFHEIYSFGVISFFNLIIRDGKTRGTPKCCIMYALLNGRLKLVVTTVLLPW